MLKTAFFCFNFLFSPKNPILQLLLFFFCCLIHCFSGEKMKQKNERKICFFLLPKMVKNLKKYHLFCSFDAVVLVIKILINE